EHVPPEVQARELSLVPQDLGTPATLGTPVEEASFGGTIMCFERRHVTEQGPVSGQELRVAPAALVHQFPECAIRDCLPDPCDLRESHVEVVEGKQAFPIFRGPEFFCGMRTTDCTGTGQICKLADPVTAVRGEVPAVFCIECVSSRIEEIAPHRGGKGKHGRVAGTKKVDTGSGRESPLCRHHDADKIAVPV